MYSEIPNAVFGHNETWLLKIPAVEEDFAYVVVHPHSASKAADQAHFLLFHAMGAAEKRYFADPQPVRSTIFRDGYLYSRANVI